MIGCIGVIPVEDKFVAIQCKKHRGIIFPGGKFEAGMDNTFKDTVRREVWEETGLSVEPHHMRYLWNGPAGDGFTCFSFLCLQYTGELALETNEGIPMLATKAQYMTSDFAAYYDVLFDILARGS